MNRKKNCENNSILSKSKTGIDSLLNMPYFEMDGNKEVRIEGCKGILEYDNCVIRINTCQMITCFKGRGLNLKSMSPTSLIIEGFITSIEFTM